MEKILLVLNAIHPDSASINFACYFATLTHSRLTAVFVENIHFKHIPPGGIDNPDYFTAIQAPDVAVKRADTEQSVRLFTDACARKHIKHEVYINRGDPIAEISFESRFADLLMIDPAINFYERDEELPSDFLKTVLHYAECPVLLAPQSFAATDEIIFCYDGSPSSVFAIKQFTYLLPEFSSSKALLLEVTKHSSQEFEENDRKMLDWMRTHYTTVQYHSLTGRAHDELFNFLFMKKNKMVVMGAYGRSVLSSLLRKSSAELLIRFVDLPIFITHI